MRSRTGIMCNRSQLYPVGQIKVSIGTGILSGAIIYVVTGTVTFHWPSGYQQYGKKLNCTHTGNDQIKTKKSRHLESLGKSIKK
jgi:hypothetical protein